MTYEQAVLFLDSFKAFRLATVWGTLSASFPGYAYEPPAGEQVNRMGGQGVSAESMARARVTVLYCEEAVGLQAGDMVKALSGTRAGRFYNVRLTTPNDLANTLECELVATRDLPDGVS